MGSTLRRYRIQIVVQFRSGFYEYDPQILMYPQPVINLTSLLAAQLHDIGWWPVSFTCWCMTAFKTRLVRYKEGAGNRSEHWHSSVDSDLSGFCVSLVRQLIRLFTRSQNIISKFQLFKLRYCCASFTIRCLPRRTPSQPVLSLLFDFIKGIFVDNAKIIPSPLSFSASSGQVPISHFLI